MARKPAKQKEVRFESKDVRKTAAYWMADDNIQVLTGLALQCRTLEDLANILGVHPATVRNWRSKHPVMKDAIDLGRDFADAMVINSTFMDAVNEDGPSRRLWWQYRIAAKENAAAEKMQAEQQGGDARDAKVAQSILNALAAKAAEVWSNEAGQDADV